jgi:hypothetical protein
MGMARWVALALLATAGALQACSGGPGREDGAIGRLQTLLCEKALECGCGSPLGDFADPVACGDWDLPYYNDAVAFDPGCVERWASWVDELTCQATERPSYADLCPLYHGTLRGGEACENHGLITETSCDRGFFCIAGTCRDPLHTSFGGQGDPCDLGERCDDGLTCVGLCIRLPGPGEVCLEGFICNAESSCNDGLCDAGFERPCGAFNDCREGWFCSSDPVTGSSQCQLAGEVGAPCMGHRECTSGNCPAGVCEDPAGVGDQCGSQLPCGPGLACSGGECQSDGSAATCELIVELVTEL